MLVAGDASHRTEKANRKNAEGMACKIIPVVIYMPCLRHFCLVIYLFSGDLRHRLPTCRAFGTFSMQCKYKHHLPGDSNLEDKVVVGFRGMCCIFVRIDFQDRY